MPPWRLVVLTALTMVAFAGNTVLCRLALRLTDIDAATFTSLRLTSGALVLWLLVRSRGRAGSAGVRPGGNWRSALALFAYAAPFSFAYIHLSAGTGALLLFGAVQATMIFRGLMTGERLSLVQFGGLLLALAGLVALVLPGVTAPQPVSSALMLVAGVAWGVYSLLGRGSVDALAATSGNFLRAAPLAILLSLVTLSGARLDGEGAVYALMSGAVASGLGYALWYTVLPGLSATRAATVQLSVPVFSAMAGVVLLAEPVTLRLFLSSLAILGGIALVITRRRRNA